MIERILELMKAHNMTAKELAQRLNIGSGTVSEWKKGKTRPSVEHVRKLSELFGVSTDYIINGTVRTAHVFSADDADSIIDNTMLDVFSRLTAEHRDAVRDFLYMCIREYDNNSNNQKSTPENTNPKNVENPTPLDTDNGFPSFEDFDAGL
ncbi:MAG: helix-turn-helix transcriptional regulator [Clostridia bacterium]|nr:helix-turn-helix transcriptional regulator [Clostridia bacterium]